VTTMESIFFHASSFNKDLFNWNTSSVTDMESMFNRASAFNHDLSNWNVEAVTDMRFMFQDASAFNQVLCWTLNAGGVNQFDMFLNSGGGSINTACPSA
jgi:surface protein